MLNEARVGSMTGDALRMTRNRHRIVTCLRQHPLAQWTCDTEPDEETA
jgi:hypothetical protein